MSDERWLPVTGWPGYHVSSLGRVRSVPRVLGDGRRAGGVILRQRADAKGYPRVHLSDGTRQRTVRVHVLVAAAFLGPRPPGMQILHRNDDHSGNDVDSLSYGTARQNVRERVRRERNEKRKEEKKGNGRKKKRGKETGTGEIGNRVYRVLPVASPVAAGGEP